MHLGDGILCIIHLTVYITEVVYYITVKHYRLLSLYRLVKLLEVSYVNAVANAHNSEAGRLILYVAVAEGTVYGSLTDVTVFNPYNAVLAKSDVCYVGCEGKLIRKSCAYSVFIIEEAKRDFVRCAAELGSANGKKIFIAVGVTDLLYYEVLRRNDDICRRYLFRAGLLISNCEGNGGDAGLFGIEEYYSVYCTNEDYVVV